MPTVRPGYVWDEANDEFIQIGPGVVESPVYYQATEPASAPTGALWVESDVDVPVSYANQYRWQYTAIGGETSLSGGGLTYSPGYEQLFLNGVLLVRGQDYAATTGTTITGLSALVAGDAVELLSIGTYPVADTYTQSSADAKFALKTGPAFGAYASAGTNIATGAVVKIGFQTEEFDTNNNYDTTLSRFTPTVAGYYQITALVSLQVASAGIFTPFLYKNGTEFKLGATQTGSGSNFPRGYVSCLVYANGTTDYFEIYAGHSYGSTIASYPSSSQTYFTASYARGA